MFYNYSALFFLLIIRRISSSGQLHPLDSKNAFGTKKQLSSSTSNLLEDKRTENIIPQLQAQLSKAFHDKVRATFSILCPHDMPLAIVLCVLKLQENEILTRQNKLAIL